MRWRVVVAVLTAFATATAQAQDAAPFERRLELVIGGQNQLGLLIPMAESWALRFDGGLQGTVSGTSGAFVTGPNSTWTGSIGVSALRYRASSEHFRSYTIGRLAFQHTEPTGSFPTRQYIAVAGIGATGRVEDRLAVFGEFGFQYTFARQKIGTPGSYSYSEISGWSLPARIGVTLRRSARQP